MEMSGIPFVVTDWAQVERTPHKGERGTAYWQTRNFADIRVRMDAIPQFKGNIETVRVPEGSVLASFLRKHSSAGRTVGHLLSVAA